MTLKDAFNDILRQISGQYPHQAPRIAGWLIELATGKQALHIVTHPQELLTPEQVDALSTILKQLISDHKPLQYILGSVPFLDLELIVRPPLLIPRPETEYLCSWLIERLEDRPLTILDMCTGTGCIGLSLAQALSASTVYLADSSPLACTTAQENALKNNLTNVTIFQSDLFTELPHELRFDLIISNPPYVTEEEWSTLAPEIRLWEDPQALKAGEDGLSIIRAIIEEAPHWLTPHKSIPYQLVLELGHKQGPQTLDLLEKAGFHTRALHTDLSGKDRFVTGRI